MGILLRKSTLRWTPFVWLALSIACSFSGAAHPREGGPGPNPSESLVNPSPFGASDSKCAPWPSPTGGQSHSSSPTPAAASPFTVVKQFEETSFFLKDVDFPTADIGWAVGEPHWDQAAKAYTGTILKTNDGGSTWLPQPAGIFGALFAVSFIDGNNGWAVGEQGVILHTTKGGQNWARLALDTTDDLSGVSFASLTEGWVIGSCVIHYDSLNGLEDDWRGSVWHTKDGGETWQKQTLPESADLLSRVEFIDPQHGWIVGQKYTGLDIYDDPYQAGVVYTTSDGGETWTELYSPGPYISLTGLSWIDADTGWVAGFPTRSSIREKGFVFHTVDGGKTWERQTDLEFGDYLLDIQFIDAQRGYTVGAEYAGAWGPPVLRTADGGKTWEKVRMALHESEGLWGVAVAGDRVIAVGDHDILTRSDSAWDPFIPLGEGNSSQYCDNGECLFTQSYLNTHYSFQDVFFSDSNNGWAAGSRSYLPNIWGQVIMHTADGGGTWAVQYEQAPRDTTTPSEFRLDSLSFADPQYGWAVGRSDQLHGAILHTSDGGSHWSEQQAESANWDNEFFSVQFIDRRNGWALSGRGFSSPNVFLLHTIDGGPTWNWVDTQIPGTIQITSNSVQGEISFIDTEHGWVVGGNGEILSTDDGGIHWEKKVITSCGDPSCQFPVFSMAVIDPLTVWIAGSDLYSTTDGGAQWKKSAVDFRGFIQAIRFPDREHGFFATDTGEIWFTADGGRRWSPLGSGTGLALKGLFFINAGRGWLVGDGGAIVSLTGGD